MVLLFPVTLSALALWWLVQRLCGYSALVWSSTLPSFKLGARQRTRQGQDGLFSLIQECLKEHSIAVALSEHLQPFPPQNVVRWCFQQKLRIQQVNLLRVQDVATWSHTSRLYYSQYWNTFLACLYGLSSASLYLNHMNSLKPVLLLSHLTVQLGSNERVNRDRLTHYSDLRNVCIGVTKKMLNPSGCYLLSSLSPIHVSRNKIQMLILSSCESWFLTLFRLLGFFHLSLWHPVQK